MKKGARERTNLAKRPEDLKFKMTLMSFTAIVCLLNFVSQSVSGMRFCKFFILLFPTYTLAISAIFYFALYLDYQELPIRKGDL